MMIQQSAHDRMVREVADRYISQGYTVVVEPRGDQLPDFLKGYNPDLIVTTPEGHIITEVKTKGKVRQRDHWEQLKTAVEAHPGWQFQLVIDSRREEELLSTQQTTLSEAEIEARLLASQNLVDQGLLDSALLVIWSTLEAILREASRTNGLLLPDQGAAPLITGLYTKGNLHREDYDLLMQILRARNQAAHGFHVENISRSLIDKAQKIVHRLKK